MVRPDVWQQLGSPRFLNILMVFVSPCGTELLKQLTNQTVCDLASKHKQAGIQFAVYVVVVLTASVVYFTIA